MEEIHDKKPRSTNKCCMLAKLIYFSRIEIKSGFHATQHYSLANNQRNSYATNSKQ